MALEDNFFTKQEISLVPRPNYEQLDKLCCVDACGRLWTTKVYLTDRIGYDRLLFVFVEQGEMFLEYADKKHIIKKGEAFFIDCMERQVYGTHGDSCVLTFLHIKGGASRYLYNLITEKTGVILRAAYAQATYRAIENVMLNSVSYLSNNVDELSGIASAALYELLSLRPKADPIFLQAEQMIRSAVTHGAPITVDSLAHGVGYSKYYFTRKFTQHFGISPHEFIIRERLTMAKNLLINSTRSIGDIALECGFFDTSHMTNCFKKREGIAPLGFRKKWRRPV